MSKWFVYAKKADFKKIGDKFGIDQVLARIIRNRDICTEEDVEMYLNGTIESMHNPRMLKDAMKAADILLEKIQLKAKIRVVGDYDIDGVCSTSILYKALFRAGAKVDYMVPDRISDGYGINIRIIDAAIADGIDTLITCDNGIAAIEQINYAKSKGMTVIVTDHHDIPYTEADGVRSYLRSDADAIVDPKQAECTYPFKMLCGAGVAYKLVQIIYEKLGLPKDDLTEYAELMAIATIGDIVDLKDENRIIVKFGLKHLAKTKNVGILALVEACQLDIAKLSAYHIGFVIGPCLNASGRLDSALKAVKLLLTEDKLEAAERARELQMLNEERKNMTDIETKKAIELVETSEMKENHVLVVYLPECHESIAGIIAGRLRERFYKPVFVITDAEDGAKGSGRSVEGYNMFEEISKCSELLTKFGGHPMAAGLSLDKDKIDTFREKLNSLQELTADELTPKIWIDVPMPVGYVTMDFVNQISVLEPFGKGNEKPVFADRELTVRSSSIIGKNANVLKMQLESADGSIVQAIQFHADATEIPQRGDKISIVYYPDINEYNGRKSLQFVIHEWCTCKN